VIPADANAIEASASLACLVYLNSVFFSRWRFQ
jgi:hypothetical protein